MQRTFIYYQDAGHGWIKVPKYILKDLGIENQITACSYQRDDQAYLEEDLDASTFIKAYKEKCNKEPKFNSKFCDHSRIRSYASYEL